MPVPRPLLACAATAALLTCTAPASAAPAGALDREWSGDGLATAAFGPGSAAAGNHAVLMPDGDLVVAGVRRGGSDQAWVVARFLPDGTPDPAFGDGGRVTLDVESAGVPEGIVALPGDRVLVAGTSGEDDGAPDIEAVRLTAAGQPDPGYGGGDGRQSFGFAGWRDTLGAMTVDEQGRPYLVGTTAPAGADGVADDLYVARLTTGGVLDPTFSVDGQWTFEVDGDLAEHVTAAAAQDGELLVGGRIVDAQSPAFVARFFVAGSPSQDLTFGPNGIRWLSEPGTAVEIMDLVRLPDGRVRVAGEVGNRGFLQGLTFYGQPDPTFLGGERALADDPYPRSYDALAVEPGGGLIVAGRLQTSATTITAYARRLRADGSPDPAFAGDGEATLQQVAPISGAGAVTREPDGDVLLTGTAGPDVPRLELLTARLNGTDKADPAPPVVPGPPAAPDGGPGAAPPTAPPAVQRTTPPVKASTPRATDVIALPSARTCLSRRTIALRLKAPRGAKVVSATAKVGGGKARRLPGARVSLRGLPKGAVKITVTAKLSTGQTLTLKRTYTTCAKKKAKRKRR